MTNDLDAKLSELLSAVEAIKAQVAELQKTCNDVNIKADKARAYLDKFAEQLLDK